jgi:transposase-like protein
MITENHKCSHCQSTNIRKNGKNKTGKQKYHCLACNRYLYAAPKYSQERKKEIIHAYFERPSMRGIERILR